MGAGFSLAMRDLEIRGAGNLLGTQQSGHIATVGYELYCRLLEQAVRGLKAMPPAEPPPVTIDLPGTAWLPRDFIPDFRAKIDVYRRLSRVTGEGQVDDLAAELADRFGPLPAEVTRMLEFARLRVAAAAHGIDSITRQPGRRGGKRSVSSATEVRWYRSIHVFVTIRTGCWLRSGRSCDPVAGVPIVPGPPRSPHDPNVGRRADPSRPFPRPR